MIVDCAVYRAGKRTRAPKDLSDALDLARALEDGYVWIGLHEPTAAELDNLAEEFGLHPLAVEDALKARQRPKLEVYGDTLFMALRTIWYQETTGDIETGQVLLFLGAGFAVTVRHGRGGGLSGLRRRMEDHPEVLRCGPAAVLYAVCDYTVDGYVRVADELTDAVGDLETRVFAPGRHNEAERVYRFKREVLEFRRAVLPLLTPLDRLSRDGYPQVHPQTQPFFRDVHDHAVRVAETVESLDALLTGVLEANLAQVQVQQNEDMRRISAWVAIAAVPTMVAGIYGMNFEHMPE
ncbi:MAG: magnesium and cobalt transport protein CorA, partial [Mycobacterium leprae]